MANVIIRAMDWDEYKNPAISETAQRNTPGENAITSEQERLYASSDNKRGARDDDNYDGNSDDSFNRDEMREKTSIIPLVASNPLTIPGVRSDMTDAQARTVAIQHIQGTLETGGPAAMNLINQAARQGDKAVHKARDMGLSDTIVVVSGHNAASEVVASFMQQALHHFPVSTRESQ